MTETRETVEKLKQELQEVRAAACVEGAEAVSKVANETQLPKPVPSGRARGKAARAAAGGSSSGQLSFDLATLGLKEVDGRELAAAVQTTRAIIAEYA